MNKARIASAFIFLLISAPINVYLYFKILQYIQATELMWFLFWVSVPITVITNFIIKLTTNDD